MSPHVFVYGTLLCDEVVFGLTNTVIPHIPATLSDHRRLRVHQQGRDAKGPALVAASGHVTEGRILLSVNERCLRIFDLLELTGGLYERVTLEPVDTRNHKLRAEVYRATDEFRKDLAGDWSLDEFRRRHLAYYLSDRIPRLVADWRAAGQYPD